MPEPGHPMANGHVPLLEAEGSDGVLGACCDCPCLALLNCQVLTAESSWHVPSRERECAMLVAGIAHVLLLVADYVHWELCLLVPVYVPVHVHAHNWMLPS